MMGLTGKKIALYGTAAAVALVAIACSSDSGAGDDGGGRSIDPPPPATPAPTPAAPAQPVPTAAAPDDGPRIKLAPTPTGTIEDQIRNGWLAGRAADGWKTDISKFVPDLKVGLFTKPSGQINKDGIPSLDTPEFATVPDAPSYLRPDEPVIQIEINGDARAYPLSILMWHEIVNDEIGGKPVTVTFCPLCNSSIAFDRNHEGRVLDFGTTGWIASTDLVMYDRQTETWWQQITGQGIIGELSGTKLTFLPTSIVGWQDFTEQYADGKVLLRPTPGTIHPVSGKEITEGRTYDDSPYSGYDVAGALPSFFTGAFDSRLQPIDRVAAFDIGGESVAYPFRSLAIQPVVNDAVGGTDIVIFYDDGTESAFRTSARGQNYQTTGSTTAFERVVAGRALTFSLSGDGVITDDQTGSTWNKFGMAVEGELAGTKLAAVVHGNEFWFAIATFRPDTAVRFKDLLKAG